MNIKEINEKRKRGDIERVAELSGISKETIKKTLSSARPAHTKRSKEVIAWFSNFLECRGNVTGDSDDAS
jgi:hypothetical protein